MSLRDAAISSNALEGHGAKGLVNAIGALAGHGSIEMMAKSAEEAEQWAALLPQGMDVYIPWTPGAASVHSVTVASALRSAGMNPVPHIAARQIASHGEAEKLLHSLRINAGVTRILLVGGDSPRPSGPFPSSLSLLLTGLPQQHGIHSIGVAGYPEGHRAIPEEALTEALDAKIEAAVRHGTELFLVTQFCFDGAAILDWVRGLRSRGVDLPVRVGVAGPASIRTLIRYGVRCGIGNSLRALGSHRDSLARLLSVRGPETVVRHLAEQGGDLGIAGLHGFPFGGFARAAKWLQLVAAGRIRLAEDGGFTVDG